MRPDDSHTPTEVLDFVSALSNIETISATIINYSEIINNFDTQSREKFWIHISSNPKYLWHLENSLKTLSQKNPEAFFLLWKSFSDLDNADLQRFLYTNTHIVERGYFRLPEDKRAPWIKDLVLDEIFGIKREAMKAPPILVSALPKSASTYTAKALSLLTNRHHVSAHSPSDFDTGVSPILDRRRWQWIVTSGFVVQSHVIPTLTTELLFDTLGAQLIVIFRNLCDALRSKAIHDKAGFSDSIMSKFTNISDAERLDLTIEKHAFLYMNFIHDWHVFSKSRSTQIYTYEALTSDWSKGLTSMLQHIGIQRSQQKIDQCLSIMEKLKESNSQAVRFTDQTAKSEFPQFTADQIARIRKIAAHFPDPEMFGIR